jgi:hypothetical protein
MTYKSILYSIDFVQWARHLRSAVSCCPSPEGKCLYKEIFYHLINEMNILSKGFMDQTLYNRLR